MGGCDNQEVVSSPKFRAAAGLALMWSARRKSERDAASATRHPFLEEAGSDLQPTHVALQRRRPQPRHRCALPRFHAVIYWLALLFLFLFPGCRCVFTQPRRFVGSTSKPLQWNIKNKKKESGNSGSTLWSPSPQMPVNATKPTEPLLKEKGVVKI